MRSKNAKKKRYFPVRILFTISGHLRCLFHFCSMIRIIYSHKIFDCNLWIISGKYFQSLVRRYLDEECSLSQVERLALQKAIQSIKDDDVPSSSMLSPVTYRTDATTAAASPRYLLSSLQFSTQSSKTAVDASEQHPTRPRLKIIPHGLPCTPKSVSVRSNSPLQSTYLPFRRHPSPCSAPSRTQNRRPDLSRCQTAIDHSTQCSVKLEGKFWSSYQ